MAERDRFLDATRGTAILFVVFGHAIQSANAMLPYDPVLNVIMTFWMPLFFLISGYASGYGSYPGFLKGLRSLMMRLGLPYVIWAEVVYLMSVAFFGTKVGVAENWNALLQSGFWFLRILLEVKMMFLVYQSVARRVKGVFFAEAVAILAAVAFGGVLSALGQSSVFHYAPLFALGYVANRVRGYVSSRDVGAMAVACILCFCCGIGLMNVGVENLFVSGLVDKGMAIAGSVTVVVMTGFLCQIKLVDRALQVLGRWSLAIYAVHWCLCSILMCFVYGHMLRLDQIFTQ